MLVRQSLVIGLAGRRDVLVPGTAAALSLLLLASCSGKFDSRSPSVLLVTMDTTRADHLGAYGYFRDTTPHLDELAAESIVFDRCVVPMASTLPSHTSLLTGTFPTEHGVLANVQHLGRQFVVPDHLQTFPMYLGSLGYQTAAFVSAGPLKRGTGIERGFETFDQPEGREQRARTTTTRALAWLKGLDPARSFFLWVHYFDPHDPYSPPQQYRDTYQTDAALERFLRERNAARTSRRAVVLESVVTRHAVNLYDAEIRYMDEQIGRLFDGLESAGLWDDLVVVAASDHGEGLGQHEDAGHGSIWGEQLYTALIMRIPGETPRRVPQVVSSVDAFPTLLGRLELPGAAGWLEQASGRDALSDEDPASVLSRNSKQMVERFGRPDTYTLTTQKWKYVWSPSVDEERLYFLPEDPFELQPVQDDHPNELARLRDQLREMLSAQRARAVRLGSGTTRPAEPELLDQLRELGYLGEE